MSQKISRNEKHKYSNEGPCWKRKYKRSNKYCPGGWQEHFWIILKLRNKQSSIYQLKMF